MDHPTFLVENKCSLASNFSVFIELVILYRLTRESEMLFLSEVW